ncbi:uncharacterized protein F5147DRAFT_780033 [Suillus discolor]|uniref:Uncharacterized protein n=1 Tax=Suillus discolor TaxID=1912936 RepID=A0A9P7EU84_9AGAM|nr:uncharacterized protein F5147DRAFT_780033 [Suillus discolor]KAG2091349.1 hypothetical protein F5147DRAFT_780033 [Suillus discolor]
MSSVKELLSHRKKPCISPDEIRPAGLVELNEASFTGHFTSGQVEAFTASQHPEVPVVPLPLPSLVTGSDVTPDCEGEQIDKEDDMSLAQCRPRHKNYQLPMRFRDVLPQPPPTVPLEVRKRLPESVGSLIVSEQPASLVSAVFRTPPNIFGLVWQYFSSKVPSHDPEEYITITDLSFIPGSPEAIEGPHAPVASTNNSQYHPYPNRSSFELGDWYWNHGLQKSQGDYEKLLQILGSSTFNAADISSTCWKKINSQLGTNEYDEEDGEEWEDEDVGWKRTAITIQVPFSRTAEIPGPRLYEAAHLYHRSLVAVLREKLAKARDDMLFHYEPYQLRWAPRHLDGEVSIYGDLYTSVAFHEAHSDLQESPREPECDLPRVIAGLMFWSDAMQVTSFGNAKLWPTYMYFGNESKYRHCKPSCNLSNHIAYFEMNYAVGSAPVEHILKPQSWVPTSNVFSDRLSRLGFNIFHALVVDLLHEFEIGIWKMLFKHLLRIISAHGKSLIHTLDQRYRQIPMFGPATIQKFSTNSSKMKRMAARNFEDLLQCSIPVFDCLLPEPHNSTVLRLLYTMAHWHGLAKLCLHSEPTLEIMDEVTTAVGHQFRHFKATVCSAYETHELPQEVKARTQCNAKQAAKQQGGQKGKQRAPLMEPESGKSGKNMK